MCTQGALHELAGRKVLAEAKVDQFEIPLPKSCVSLALGLKVVARNSLPNSAVKPRQYLSTKASCYIEPSCTICVLRHFLDDYYEFIDDSTTPTFIYCLGLGCRGLRYSSQDAHDF